VLGCSASLAAEETSKTGGNHGPTARLRLLLTALIPQRERTWAEMMKWAPKQAPAD